MAQREPLFAGLVVDEFDNPVTTAYVGDEPMYVVDDAGFRRHISAEQVDLAVLQVVLKEWAIFSITIISQ